MRTTSPVIQLDGAHHEGGGALLRTALQMSVLTQQPVRIEEVRGGTKFPGVDVEDLVVARALAQISGATTEGMEVGSNVLVFRPTRRPGPFRGSLGNERNASGRGANANIVLATVLPILARAGALSELSAEGETYGVHALGFDAFQNVTLAAWRRLGLWGEATQERAGFGRDADGEVRVTVEPSHIQGVDWGERGDIVAVRAVVATNGVAPGIAERAVHFLKRLAQSASLPMEAEHIEVGAKSPGVHVTVWALFERGIGSGAAIGVRGLRVEAVCQTAFEEMLEWVRTPCAVDPYVADALLIPSVMAEGDVTFRVSRLTARFLTSVWAVRQFTPIQLTVKGTEGGQGLVTIRR